MRLSASSTISCSQRRSFTPNNLLLARIAKKTSVCANKASNGRLHRSACKSSYRRIFPFPSVLANVSSANPQRPFAARNRIGAY
jgi:hypothetical protein